MPGGQLGDRVGRGGRDTKDVAALDEREVRDRIVIGSRVTRVGAAQRIAR